jgi:hypothetical protein
MCVRECDFICNQMMKNQSLNIVAYVKASGSRLGAKRTHHWFEYVYKSVIHWWILLFFGAPRSAVTSCVLCMCGEFKVFI